MRQRPHPQGDQDPVQGFTRGATQSRSRRGAPSVPLRGRDNTQAPGRSTARSVRVRVRVPVPLALRAAATTSGSDPVASSSTCHTRRGPPPGLEPRRLSPRRALGPSPDPPHQLPPWDVGPFSHCAAWLTATPTRWVGREQGHRKGTSPRTWLPRSLNSEARQRRVGEGHCHVPALRAGSPTSCKIIVTKTQESKKSK